MVSERTSAYASGLDFPNPIRAGHLSFRLRISERKLLLIMGDLALSGVSILIALWVWATVAQRSFTAEFVARHSYWFPLLPAVWYILASVSDYYNLKVAARVKGSLVRLARITLQLLVVYLIIFFVSPRQ